MTEVRIGPVDPSAADVAELFAASETYQLGLYPAESVHLASADELAGPGALLLGALVDGRLLGCGAYVPRGDYGELKRMFVREEARGQGVARRLLAALERHALDTGIRLLRLETGVLQTEAIRLYERAGYVRRERYGVYPDDPLSIFMEKRL